MPSSTVTAAVHRRKYQEPIIRQSPERCQVEADFSVHNVTSAIEHDDRKLHSGAVSRSIQIPYNPKTIAGVGDLGECKSLVRRCSRVLFFTRIAANTTQAVIRRRLELGDRDNRAVRSFGKS